MSANENIKQAVQSQAAQGASAQAKGQNDLTELLEQSRATNDLLRRQLRSTQILAGLLVLAVLVLGVQTFFTTRAVNDLVNGPELAMLADKVSQLDVQGLNQAVNSLAEQVAALDMDGINQALSEIGSAAKGIENAMGALNRFTSLFGR